MRVAFPPTMAISARMSLIASGSQDRMSSEIASMSASFPGPIRNLRLALFLLLGFRASVAVGCADAGARPGPDAREFQGRVASIYMLTWNLQPIGIMLFGTVAQLQGVPFAIWSAGLSMVAITMLLALTRPRLRRLRV